MAISHKIHPIYGIQYHPESFGSEAGIEILQNFYLMIMVLNENKSNQDL